MSNNVVDANNSVECNEEVDVNQSDRAENSSIIADLVINHVVPLFGIKFSGLTDLFTNTLASILFYFET
jgi:hypothetical protein